MRRIEWDALAGPAIGGALVLATQGIGLLTIRGDRKAEAQSAFRDETCVSISVESSDVVDRRKYVDRQFENASVHVQELAYATRNVREACRVDLGVPRR